MCFSHSSSLRSGKSVRYWAPRLSLRSIAAATMHSALSSMNPSSSAPSRSWLKTVPRSSTATFFASSFRRCTVSWAVRSPASSRKTATYLSIVCPSSALISDTRRPLASRSTIVPDHLLLVAQLGVGGLGAPACARAASAACSPERRPNTSVSSSELAPRRLPPCTETQAHSPAA